MYKKILISLGLVVLGRYLFNKVNLANNLTFSLNDISLKPNLPTSQLYINLNIINPTNATGTVNSIDGKLFVNKNYVGFITQQSELKILANSTTKITYNVALNSLAVVNNIIAAFKTKTSVVNFNGIVKVDGVNLPLNIDYKVF
jgi:hypothetical protein